MASLCGEGAPFVLNGSTTSAGMVTLMDASAAVGPDKPPCKAIIVSNLDSTNILMVHVDGLHAAATGATPIPPSSGAVTLAARSQGSGISVVKAYACTPTGGTFSGTIAGTCGKQIG